MKSMLHTALATLALFVPDGFGDDKPAAAAPAPERAAGDQTPAEREAVVLHEWMGAVFLGFNAEGRLIAYDSARRVFEVHDLAATNAAVTGWNLPEDGGKVFSGALSADRRTLATVSEVGRNQSRLQLWNALTGEKAGPAFAPSDVAHVVFSPDGKTLAGVVALDGTMRVWDTTTGKLRWSQALPSPMQVTWIGIQFSPDGRFVAARNSYALQIWDLIARKVAGAGDLAFFHDISPDWKLAHGFILKPAAQQEPRIALFDITDPNQPVAATSALPDDLVASMEMGAFSADGRFLALSMRDQTIRLWNIADRRVTRQLPKTGGRMFRLLVSPDNRRLATYEVDLSRQRSTLRGSVRLWDVATGQALGVARPHPGTFWGWQFDPDSRHLVVSFAQGNDTFGAQVWRLPPGEHSGAAPQAAVVRDPAPPVLAGAPDGFAEDAFRLCGLLEAWPGKDRTETSRLLAEAFVAGLLQRHPDVPADQRRELAIEFEPRIAMAFQNLAAEVCREHFTHEELRELIRFYETPLGRKYARAYPDWKDRIAAGDAERRRVVDALLARVRRPGTAGASHPSPAPRIAPRTFTADLKSWPVTRTQHGATAFEAGGYVMRPSTNTWIGPGNRLDVNPLAGDFVPEMQFRIDERKPSAAISLNLAGTGAVADYVDVFLAVWSDTNVTYTIEKGTIKDNFYANRDESIAERVPAPKALADHDWSQGGRITLHREERTMRLLVNGALLKAFPVSQFIVRKVGLGAAFESVVVINSLEAGTP